MAVKTTLLTFFSSALLASCSGPDGFLAQGTTADEQANPGNTGVVTAELEQAVRSQDAVAASGSNAEPARSADLDSLPEVGEVSAEAEDSQAMPETLAFLGANWRASAEEDSLPEVGEVSAEEDNQEMPESLAFLGKVWEVSAEEDNQEMPDSLVDFLQKVWEVPAEEDTQEMPDSLVAFLETLELSSTEAADSDENETVGASAAHANCDTKMLRQLQKKVGHHTWHECVDPNPEVCHAVDAAIKAYLRKGGKRAAKKSICRHQGDFKDAFEHNYEKCKKLADKASTQGLHLPDSPEDLKHYCR